MNSMSLHPNWILAITFGLAVIPLLVALTTSYIKISIVIGTIKNAIGLQHAPGLLAESALSFSLSVLIMSPVFVKVGESFPYIRSQLLQTTPSFSTLRKVEELITPWKDFLRQHSGERELRLLEEIQASKGQLGDGEEKKNFSTQRTDTNGDVPHSNFSLPILLPAFLLTELKEALVMSFYVLVPFLAVDLIVANLLAGLGMMMVTPQMISLPLKILLFVACDGWMMITKGLVDSYQGIPIPSS